MTRFVHQKVSFVLRSALLTLAVWGVAAAPARAEENQNTLLGFPVTFSGYEATATAEGMSVKAAGAVDLSAALGEGASLQAGAIEIDPKGNVTLKKMTLPAFTIGPFEGKLAAEKLVVDHTVTLTEPFLLDVTLGVKLDYQTLHATARLPITAKGLADGEVTFSPPKGQENFLSLTEGDLSLVVSKGQLTIVGGKVQKAAFSGALTVLGSELAVQDLTLENGKISGHVAGQFDLDQVALSLPKGLDFAVSQTGEISIAPTAAEFDFSGALADIGKLSIDTLSFQKGVLNAESALDKTLSLEGVSLSLAKAKVTGDQKGVTATFDGSLGLEGLDLKADFTGFTVDSKGNVAGEITFSPAVSLDISGLGVSVEKCTFTKKDQRLIAALSGNLKIGEDSIKVTRLGVKNSKPWVTLGVSEQEPFSFSWLPYLKLTQLNLEDDQLTLGGAIEIPDPAKYTFSFKDTKIDLKSKTPAFPASIEKRAIALWGKTPPNMVVFENTSAEKMKLGPLNVGLNALAIPNPFDTSKPALSSDTILQLFLSAQVTAGGTDIAFDLDGLAFSKEGLKDITLTVKPPAGKPLLADLSLEGIGGLKLASAKVEIKNKKVLRVSFPGAKLKVKVPDLDLEFGALSLLVGGDLYGYIPFPKLKEFDLPGFGLSLKGIEFMGLSTGFSLNFEGKLKFGLDLIPIKSFKISSLGWNVALDVSLNNPFKLSWLPFIKFSQIKLSKVDFTLGGDLDLPDLGKFKFTFSDVKISLEKPELPVVFLNTDTRFMTWNGLSIRVGSITLPNPLALGKKLAKAPEVVLGLALSTSIELLGKKISFDLSDLNFTKDGLKDISLDITPPSGGSLFSEKLLNWATVDIKGATLSIKNKKFDSFGFSGKINLDGTEFEFKKLGLGQDKFTGTLILPADPKLSIGSLSLALDKEISFEIGTKTGGTFDITLKNVTLDATGLLGDKAKLVFDTLTYGKGVIKAESSKGLKFSVGSFSLDVSKFSLDSQLPASGKRVLDAYLDGNVKLSAFSLDLSFKKFKVSSSGTVDGTIDFKPEQSWKVFGFGIALKSMTVTKGSDTEPLVLTFKGKFKFTDSVTFDFDNLKIVNGKPVLMQEFKTPLTVDVKIVKISVSKVELGAGEIKLTGKVKIPVIDLELSAKDFAFDSSGNPTGGSVTLDKEVSFTVAKFGITVKKASINVTNKVFAWDADIELFGTKIPLKDLRISLGSSPAHDLTKKTGTKPASLKIDLIGLEVSPTSMDFGVKNLKFFFAFSGKLKILTSELDFTNLRIYQDYSFTVDEVKGKIGLDPFVVNIKSASFGEDFLKFTGDMNIPMVGTATVGNLKVSKTGVFLENATLIVEKPGFSYDFNITFKDKVFSGAGNLNVLKSKLALKLKVDTTAITLTIDGKPSLQLGAGLMLQDITGTLVQKYKTELPDISMAGMVVYLDKKFLRSDVSFSMNGQSEYAVNGKVTILDNLEIAKMKIEGNVAKGTFLASGNLNVTVLDLVGLNVDISLGSTDKTIASETKLKEPKKCEPSTTIFSKNPYLNCSLKKLEDDAHKEYRRDFGGELSDFETKHGPIWKNTLLSYPYNKRTSICPTAFKEDNSNAIYYCAISYIWGEQHDVQSSDAWLKGFSNVFKDLKKLVEDGNSSLTRGQASRLKCDSSGNCGSEKEYGQRRFMSLALSGCVDHQQKPTKTTAADLEALIRQFGRCTGYYQAKSDDFCAFDYSGFNDIPDFRPRPWAEILSDPKTCRYLFSDHPDGYPTYSVPELNPYDYGKGYYSFTTWSMKDTYGGFHNKKFTEKTVYEICGNDGSDCLSTNEIFKLVKLDKDGNLPANESWSKLGEWELYILKLLAADCYRFTKEGASEYGVDANRYAADGKSVISSEFCNNGWSSKETFFGWNAYSVLSEINMADNQQAVNGRNTVESFLMAVAFGYDTATNKFPGRTFDKDKDIYWSFKGALDWWLTKGATNYDQYLAMFFGGDPGSIGYSSTPLRDKDFVTKFEASGTVKIMGKNFSVKLFEQDKKLRFNANREFDLGIADGSVNLDGTIGVNEVSGEIAAKMGVDIPVVGEGSLAGTASFKTSTKGAAQTTLKTKGCMEVYAASLAGSLVNSVSSWFGGPSDVVPTKICKKFDAKIKISKDGLDLPSLEDLIEDIFL